jgi:hypothetical protein
VIGVFLVVRPGVPAHDRIDLEQADQKDQAALELVLRGVAHAVVAIVQVEDALQSQHPRHLVVVALVAEHVLADRPGRAQPARVAHVVVGGADEVAGVALAHEFGHGARGRQRDVVGVGLDGQQDLALVGSSLGRALEEDVAGSFLGNCP